MVVVSRGLHMMEECLTNFEVDSLHVAGCFSNIDLVFMVWIRDDGENLRGKFDGVALGVLRFRSLAGCFVQSGAAAYQQWRAQGREAAYVVWK